MPGTLTFRPVEANLVHDTDWLGKMDPYCMFTLNGRRFKGQICRHGGTRPHWDEAINIPTDIAPSVVRLDILDKDKLRPDDSIAGADIDLGELQRLGTLSRWYPLYHKKKLAGEVLLEATYQPQMVYQQPIIAQTVIPTTVTTTVLPAQTFGQQVPLETIGQQQFIGQSYEIPTTIGTNLGGLNQGGLLLNQGLQQDPLLQGQNLGLIGTQVQSGLPLTQNLGGLQQGFIQDPNAGLINNAYATGISSKTSAFGPQGGFPHGNHTLKGTTNAGYSVRPGYTLGNVEANPTCQSNLDTNGGGFFNKPGRERRAEPYTLSNPGTYGIPHGDTIDTSGHLVPGVQLARPAPIGQINQPGITGYPDGFNNNIGNPSLQTLNQGFPGQQIFNQGLTSKQNPGTFGQQTYTGANNTTI